MKVVNKGQPVSNHKSETLKKSLSKNQTVSATLIKADTQSSHELKVVNKEILHKEQPVSNHKSETLEKSLSKDQTVRTTLIKVKEFENYVKNAISSNLLNEQYQTYVRDQTKPWDHGMLPHYKPKNRYINIIPYDETRVVLKKLPDEPHSDYINANYIKGVEDDRIYIATQGPKSNTVADFWRMIWQENVEIICMLANVVEDKKNKCEKYWPDFEQRRLYGSISVKNIANNVCPNYTFRTFEVHFDGKIRTVQHLHFTAWEDHGVPKSTHSVVAYLRKLVSIIPSRSSPIVVHCSAGVGRTGSIIVAHICVLRAELEGVIDVYGDTAKVREQRVNLIDNDQQYTFVHLVILEYLITVETALPCNEYLSTGLMNLKKTSKIQRQRLRDTACLDEILNPTTSKLPLSERQLAKNRFPSLADGAITRLNLQIYPKTDASSDYISAVFVPGVQGPRQYIASQLPLPSTWSDFWRMIAQYKVEMVVVLQLPDQHDPTCCEVMPKLAFFEPTPYLAVTSTKSESMDIYSVEDITLIDKSEESMRKQYVTILSYVKWKQHRGQALPPAMELVTLFKIATRMRKTKEPVVVLCHNGVTGCGLYLALNNVIERMKIEKECDVWWAVRTVRQARSDFVETVEQLEYLHDAASIHAKTYPEEK